MPDHTNRRTHSLQPGRPWRRAIPVPCGACDIIVSPEDFVPSMNGSPDLSRSPPPTAGFGDKPDSNRTAHPVSHSRANRTAHPVLHSIERTTVPTLHPGPRNSQVERAVRNPRPSGSPPSPPAQGLLSTLSTASTGSTASTDLAARARAFARLTSPKPQSPKSSDATPGEQKTKDEGPTRHSPRASSISLSTTPRTRSKLALPAPAVTPRLPSCSSCRCGSARCSTFPSHTTSHTVSSARSRSRIRSHSHSRRP